LLIDLRMAYGTPLSLPVFNEKMGLQSIHMIIRLQATSLCILVIFKLYLKFTRIIFSRPQPENNQIILQFR
jgi:hypothetical protein